MIQSRLVELIARKKAGEISPPESVELNALLKDDEEAQLMLHKADLIWNALLEPGGTEVDYVDERWDKLSRRLQENSTKEIKMQPVSSRRLLRYSIAASVAAAVLTGAVILFNAGRSGMKPKQNIVSTKNGSRTKIELPDGSAVWLNTGSKLIYSDAFGEDLREVHLSGEAFFDVAKDAAHPFIIHANEIDIKVLGTAFNVRAYPDDKRTEATLIRGLIEVSFKDRPADRLYLKPNEKISVMNGEIRSQVRDDLPGAAIASSPGKSADEPVISFSRVTYQSPRDSTILETAWIKNRFVFRNKSFEELIKDMERWYNVCIECKNPELLLQHFTGSFYHESVAEALDILKLSYPFHYTIDKNQNSVVIQ
ncbi:FecR family protein [Filimonas effusa]|uniref:FecR family protein n=1 Tax=Filimonas effusa TaxID=2508721 RepID=A0A4Q1D856_9BACT|nr:FecR domain-containing protein [Filimonas effusa]RXK85441.1 FecR family protein [Filimonas effusa]